MLDASNSDIVNEFCTEKNFHKAFSIRNYYIDLLLTLFINSFLLLQNPSRLLSSYLRTSWQGLMWISHHNPQQAYQTNHCWSVWSRLLFAIFHRCLHYHNKYNYCLMSYIIVKLKEAKLFILMLTCFRLRRMLSIFLIRSSCWFNIIIHA